MSAFPKDWPLAGPIDLAVHDLPHRSAMTEWWYLNAHLEPRDGARLSLFAAFFRIVKGQNPVTRELEYAHSVTWALTDADGKVYSPESRVDRCAPELGLERIAKGAGSRDPLLNRAISEMLKQGRVPTPDRRFDGEVFVAPNRLELDFAGSRFEKREDGSYRLVLSNPREASGCELVFTPGKAAIRHGDDGLVKGMSGEDMFYYFIPRCRVTGTVTMGGRAREVSGDGWYDHEFGGPPENARMAEATPSPSTSTEAPPERVDIAWNWCAAQLDGNRELSAYSLVRVDDGEILYQWAILIDADGERRAFHNLSFEALDWWRSTRTFYDYPVRWRLRVPEAALDLTVTAAFPDQEFITVISKPAFWEGRVDISGTLAGQQVGGLGYVERSGFQPVSTLDEFFGAVGEEVRKSVSAVLPLSPTHEEARSLIASEEREHYMDGVDRAQLARTLLAPIRAITDRGGKSWRSYAALACCDVVQGDSRRFVQWLAIPELLHVGSLIVDDVQDRSTVRRGGPTCHVVYGEPLAINAGTAAYFIAQRLLVSTDVSNARKLRLYDLYFEAMRAGHAGQALDLDGLGDVVPAVVESGDTDQLERRVLATHRLKTAAPAGALARMGAVAGGGTDAQIEAVGRFFEALGLAFQIVDDVLNLRGFKGNLKQRAEDLSNGIVTLPVAKALSRLPLEGRRQLWALLQSKPTDPVVLSGMVETIESVGALAACVDQARDLVESAWAAADPLLEDSIPKVMLRAFGWYILERHY